MKLQLANNPALTGAGRVREQFVAPTLPNLKQLQRLTEFDRVEVLAFLKFRPVHTVVMASFIQDNGFESESNRGKFYGYRNAAGKLEAVALIGHTTLIESRSEDALRALAVVARQSETPIKMMMADDTTIEKFWQHYAGYFQKPRLSCEELMFELNFPFFVQDCPWKVRNARAEEVEIVAEAHAEVAFIESGVNPLEKDREGFLRRCLKRIEQKRTFIVTENGKLIFKADVVAESEDVVYLEGIYVAPEMRGQNLGSKCLAKLSLSLLERAQSICLLSNKDFKGAHRSFEKAGFKNTGCCQTLFV